jgi:hypothetical protein
VTATVPLVLDDILSSLAANGTSLSFALARMPLSFVFQVLRGSSVVDTPAVVQPSIGAQTLTWDGTLAGGARAADGTYALALTVVDGEITFTRSVAIKLDRTKPVLRALSYSNLRFHVSEPATLVLSVGARRYTRTLKAAGATQFWLKTRPPTYTLTATDVAGNVATLRYRR